MIALLSVNSKKMRMSYRVHSCSVLKFQNWFVERTMVPELHHNSGLVLMSLCNTS